MTWHVRPVSLALVGLGSVLLLASAAGLYTGIPAVLDYAVPLALVGGAVAYVAVRLLERDVDEAVS